MELNHNLNSNDKVFIFKIATLIDRHTTKDYRGGAAGQNFQSPRVGLAILILAVRPSEGRYCICPSAVTSRHFLKSWTRIFRHLGNIQAVGKCDSYQISLPDQTFLSEWVNLKFFNFFWPGSLSYMVLNWIRCGFFFLGGGTCPQSDRTGHTPDLYVIKSPICAWHGWGRLLGRETDNYLWICKVVLSNSIDFMFNYNLIPPETWSVKWTSVAIALK